MSTDAEKVGAMVAAMISASNVNKKLHQEIDQLKAELSELQAGYYFIDSESMRKGSIINELNDEITALKEKIRGLECDFQLDANRAIEYKEKLALAVSSIQNADCSCSILVRISGHAIGCWKPELEETLAKIQGEKMEGKE